MGKTIKRKEVIAYKGMNSDMTCKGFQYEVGKSYKTDKVELCNYGFHACLNPIDVLDYYPKYLSSRYFKVKLSGEITKCSMWDTNVAATKITILEEIPSNKFLTNTEWWKNDNVLDLLYYSDGFARVKNCERQYNFIGKDGKILSEQWFVWVDDFKDGFAVVKNEDYVYNFIDKKGKFLSEQWFEKAFDFNEGFAVVEKPIGLRNYIDKDGKLLSDEWFNNAHSFKDGLAKVQRRDGLWSFINKQGNYLSNEWFNYLDDFFIDGFARAQRTNGECCKIDKSGKLYKD